MSGSRFASLLFINSISPRWMNGRAVSTMIRLQLFYICICIYIYTQIYVYIYNIIHIYDRLIYNGIVAALANIRTCTFIDDVSYLCSSNSESGLACVSILTYSMFSIMTKNRIISWIWKIISLSENYENFDRSLNDGEFMLDRLHRFGLGNDEGWVPMILEIRFSSKVQS